MKKILLSILTIGLVSVVAAFGITQAFFSDTETSTGNILAAGAIDLLIDNTSYRTDSAGVLVASPETSWNLRDLTIEKFFNFTDLKPGDVGEDTISIHVNNNDAWACARGDISDNSENGLTEPETDLGDTATTGELGNELNFAFWNDDGDNVFESDETISVQGPAANVLNGGTLALAQPASAGPALFGNTPLTGASTEYIGKFYCYGTFTATPVTQDGVGTGNPVARGTGFSCNGSAVTNASQSDMLVGDISFYAVQSRNNPDFNCNQVQWPNAQPTITVIQSDDMATSPTDLVSSPNKWFFYNDRTGSIDGVEGINNSIGSFVVGPNNPPFGTGSAQMSTPVETPDPNNVRRNIATYQFKDIKLADIDAMSFATYSQSAGNGAGANAAPYLHFNVDFDNSDTWQRRLVFVPSLNNSVMADTWQTWDAINGGSGKWLYSGATWPGTGDPGTSFKTWSQILALYPNAETRSTDSWLGVRVGEPYPGGFTGNVDNFSITINGVVKTFDFDN